MARRLGDDAGLATCLMRSYWARGAGSRATRLQTLTEAMELGERLGRTEILAEAMSWRVPAFVDLCDLESARRAIPVLRETAERTAQPFMLHIAEHFASALALCDGRLERAERLAHRSHEWGRLLTGRDSSGVYGIQMFGVQRERGRLAELAPVVRVLAADAGRDGAWRPSLIALLAELGMEAEARRELARVAADGLDPLRATLWVGSLVYLADACSALGDETVAALVYPELQAYAGGNVMVGHLVACYGAADRYLGMLAATLGEDDDAVEHFERALALNRAMGAVTWYAHTAFEYGRFLHARRRDGAERAARRGRDARRAHRPAHAAVPGPGAGRQPPAHAARRPVPARGADPRPRRAGPEQPRARRHAVDQRAHRRQPRPQHPAQDGLRQPHRSRVLRTPPRDRKQGVDAMPLYMIERSFAEQLELTRRGRRADRRAQRRRGRALAVLVPQRRPPAHLLPLRGAVTRGDPRGRTPRQRPRRRDHRGAAGRPRAHRPPARVVVVSPLIQHAAQAID